MIGSGNSEHITSLIASFTQSNEALIRQLNQIMYWFRGALGRDDVWAMSHLERELAISFINDRFKEAGELMKNRIPVFI